MLNGGSPESTMYLEDRLAPHVSIYSYQYVILHFAEYLRKSVHGNRYISKFGISAFDCMAHELLVLPVNFNTPRPRQDGWKKLINLYKKIIEKCFQLFNGRHINIDSGNGLVASGNKLLPEPRFIKI